MFRAGCPNAIDLYVQERGAWIPVTLHQNGEATNFSLGYSRGMSNHDKQNDPEPIVLERVVVSKPGAAIHVTEIRLTAKAREALNLPDEQPEGA